MKKAVFLSAVCALFLTTSLRAQEVCENPDEANNDLNSITKCSIKPSKGKDKKSRQITVKVSVSKRYLKKRELTKKKSVASAGSLSSSGVQNSSTSSGLNKSLTLKTNIEDLKKKLSAEEVRAASKFSAVDKIPAFKACGAGSTEERANCFNEEMIKHIQKYFRYPSKAVKESLQGEVWVRFIIDKNGDVRNIKALGPKGGDILNAEAKRVVYNLPQFKPARKDGKRVAVKYGFPITFALEE